MAKLGTLKLKGSDNTTYSFDVYPSDTIWNPDVDCVYYISKRTLKRDGGGNHIEIYVGETDDLKTRLTNHHKQSCFDNHNYNAVSIHRENSEALRLQIEAALIKSIKPPCNG